MKPIKYRGFEITTAYVFGYQYIQPDLYDVDCDGDRFAGNRWGGHAMSVGAAKGYIDDILSELHWFDLWEYDRQYLRRNCAQS